MIKLKNGFLIQFLDELPNLQNKNEIFLDVETRNYIAETIWKNKTARRRITEDEGKLLKQGGLYPFGGDRVCGISITADDDKEVYYIPLRHIDAFIYKNLPIKPVMHWLTGILTTCKKWINHNVNFDAQFLSIDGVEFTCELICTLVMSKLFNSDRLSHELKEICPEYLNYDVSSSKRVSEYLKELFTGELWYNYAKIPIDILGEYGCDDILMNRQLYRFFQKEFPEEIKSVWQTEIKLTSVLFDMEKEGLKINHKECLSSSFVALHKCIALSDKIQRLSGIEFKNSVQCIYDILVNQFGMPVVVTKKEKEHGEYIDTGRPTYDADALDLYEVHPMALADSKLLEIIKAIKQFRQLSQFKNLYADTFRILCDEKEYVHTTYNQIVRTGRMSAKRPNSQQQNEQSKTLIHCDDGMGFISCDYSQIEFRLIVHYIQDMLLIKAYNENPNTDLHQWVADLMHVTRKVGKTLNFGMAYGAGKRTVIRNLSANPDIIEEMSKIIVAMLAEGKLEVKDRDLMFAKLCAEHTEKAYNIYHERIPGLKSTSRRAQAVCAQRGYIFNAYGRRRHLPEKVSYKAFNSLIQSCAMDLIKERMVTLSPRYNSQMKNWGIKLAANVHDEILFKCPLELLHSEEVKNYIIKTLESPAIQFRVPIRTEYGISEKHWAEACYGDPLDQGEP